MQYVPTNVLVLKTNFYTFRQKQNPFVVFFFLRNKYKRSRYSSIEIAGKSDRYKMFVTTR